MTRMTSIAWTSVLAAGLVLGVAGNAFAACDVTDNGIPEGSHRLEPALRTRRSCRHPPAPRRPRHPRRRRVHRRGVRQLGRHPGRSPLRRPPRPLRQRRPAEDDRLARPLLPRQRLPDPRHQHHRRGHRLPDAGELHRGHARDAPLRALVRAVAGRGPHLGPHRARSRPTPSSSSARAAATSSTAPGLALDHGRQPALRRPRPIRWRRPACRLMFKADRGSHLPRRALQRRPSRSLRHRSPGLQQRRARFPPGGPGRSA